jgi:hypothetical protein
MVKNAAWALFVVTVVGSVPSAVRAQGPGVAPPPTVPVIRGPENRRDDHDAGAFVHILHGAAKALEGPGGPYAGHGAGPHPTGGAPPEAGWAPPRSGFMPPPELRYTPPRITPVLGEGATSITRGLSSGKGGILGGIGAAIAAAFGAVFGRKKES